MTIRLNPSLLSPSSLLIMFSTLNVGHCGLFESYLSQRAQRKKER